MDALVVFDLRHESQRRHINADEERLTGAKSGSGRETEPLKIEQRVSNVKAGQEQLKHWPRMLRLLNKKSTILLVWHTAAREAAASNCCKAPEPKEGQVSDLRR